MSEHYIYRLTTIDNPFDPFEQYESWLNYDKRMNYDTPGLQSRYARTSDELSDAENEIEINDAITRVIVNDPLNMYIRVRKLVKSTSQSDEETTT